ncbi:choice-of-anchor A family protein [Streptomyces sp. IBSNAI002]|uniref:choice-of-anchor A family protein n=1 Tax=Streptomyces sp. IBSNAI002 TaxID=3457500 RepID=UPI003FCEEADE
MSAPHPRTDLESPMRAHAAVAILGLTGTFLLDAGTPAFAAPSCADAPLGAAGGYAEFVEGDSLRYSDSEGAVAVGGDARFGDPATGQGFSIGDKLTATDLGKLPGKHSMVVGGTLHANQVVLGKGSGRYGELRQSGGDFAVDGEHSKGAAPFDFAGEFATLRDRSAGWAAAEAKGSVGRSGATGQLLLTGEDKKVNVFAVNAADLQKASSVAIKVPAGSTTLVNVIGAAYDSGASSFYGIYLWDPETGKYVLDDYAAGSAQFKAIRSKLLWNFPNASSVVKNHASWPGTILAPNAHVELGRKAGSVAPGHVNGSVIAKKLTSVPGAETHRMAFAGCLPAAGAPSKPITPPSDPDPVVTPLPELPDPKDPEDVPVRPSPSTPPSDTPSDSSTSGPAAPGNGDPSQDPAADGSLASTGGGIAPALVTAGVAAVAVGGALVTVTMRRRRGDARG